jgi:hypothetical protein
MPTKTYTQSLRRKAGKTSARKKLSAGGKKRSSNMCTKKRVRSQKSGRCTATAHTPCTGASQKPYKGENPRRERPIKNQGTNKPTSMRCKTKSSGKKKKKLSAGGKKSPAALEGGKKSKKKKSKKSKKKKLSAGGKKSPAAGKKSKKKKSKESKKKKSKKSKKKKLSAGGRTTTGSGQFNRIKKGHTGAGQFAPAYTDGNKPAKVGGGRLIKQGYVRKSNDVKRRTEPHKVRGLARKCPPGSPRSNATNKKSSRCKKTKPAKATAKKSSGKTTQIKGKDVTIPKKFLVADGSRIKKTSKKAYNAWKKSKESK